MTEPQHDSAVRWAAASQIADGVTDDGFHKRRARILLQIVAIVIGSWIVGFVIALLLIPKAGSSHATDAAPTDPQLIADFVFLGLGLAVGIGGFIWARRTGHYITRWRAVSSPLNRREKKSVRRQISGKTEVDREHLKVVVAIANQNRRATLGIAPVYLAVVLIAIGQAIGSDQLSVKFLELAASLLFVVTAIQLTVLYRRAGRFVDTHSDSSS